MVNEAENANAAYSDDRDYGASRLFSPITIDLHLRLYKYLSLEAHIKLGENEAKHF
jgi:hypothetical protein